jgi:hypothetical protein
MRARAWIVVAAAILLVSVGVACAATQPATEDNVTADQETGMWIDQSEGAVQDLEPQTKTVTFAGQSQDHPAGAVIGAQTAPGVASRACAELERDGVAATPLWVRWDDIDRGTGSYYWDELDRQVDVLRACGQEVALHLQSSRPWTRGAAPDPEAFARFAGDLAAHLQGRVSRYSIENEANAQAIWPYPPETYFQLLREAYPAIKAADPNAIVMHSGLSSGGLRWARVHDLYHSGKQEEALRLAREVRLNSPGEGDVRSVGSLDALDELLRTEGVQRHVEWMRLEAQNQDVTDAFQIHYYGSWESLPPLMRWIREQGITKPFEAWEIAKRYGRQPYDPARHAEEVAKLMVSAAGEGSRWTIFVRYVDWPEKHLPGLVDADGSLPGRDAFRLVATQLNGVQGAAPVDLGSDAWGYRFDDRPEGDLWVVWATSEEPATVKLPEVSGQVTVAGIDDQTRSMDAASLEVGRSPLFVRTPG